MDNFIEESMIKDRNQDITKDKSKNDSSQNQRRKNLNVDKLKTQNQDSFRGKDRPNSVINKTRNNNIASLAAGSYYLTPVKDDTLGSGGRRNQPTEDKSVGKLTSPFISGGIDLTKPVGFRTNRIRLGRGMMSKFYSANIKTTGPTYFNLLCVGKEKVGKSSFLEHLIKNVFGKIQVVDRKEKTFVEYVSERRDEHTNGRFILNCIDSKGYSDDYPVDRWYNDLKNLIFSKVLVSNSSMTHTLK